MGLYTVRDGILPKTRDGKDVWICTYCKTVFLKGEDFFNHICRSN